MIPRSFSAVVVLIFSRKPKGVIKYRQEVYLCQVKSSKRALSAGPLGASVLGMRKYSNSSSLINQTEASVVTVSIKYCFAQAFQ